MGRIIAIENVTLDGVMQSPGRPDEDTRGGFPYGGWGNGYFDAVMGEAAAKGMSQEPALLFGRRTYQDFHAVWPNRTDGNPFTDVLNRARKYVCSRTLNDPLPWSNSVLLKGEAAETVAALKQQTGHDLGILGCGELVHTLMQHNLIDEYQLSIFPLVLGTGRRLFRDGSEYTHLQLVDSKASTTGVILATYRPA
ncbi:MAG TPA: dihydrofolate reductase family protein [Anaerolineales bacterium]|nr:dihydrofolate reductase family protein [Anaerolineales bacterium]